MSRVLVHAARISTSGQVIIEHHRTSRKEWNKLEHVTDMKELVREEGCL